MSNTFRHLALALAGAAALQAPLHVVAQPAAPVATPPQPAASGPVVPAVPSTDLARALPDFSVLVEQAGPAVVNIRTSEKIKAGPNAQLDEQMREFLRRFGIPVPQQRKGTPAPNPAPDDDDDDDDASPQRRGLGSGFVIGADGYVMTNAHVVDEADEVMVTLTDKREFKAKVVGLDRRTDVAVLKIEATGLPMLRMGDVGKLKVGEWVMAIGSPFGFDNTVTAGIVSAKARDTGDLLPLIQTDVAINPGNSGGPLLNLRGEVVGINSQIYSQSGGFMGISFAIPIDEAMRVADQLRSKGRVTRGMLGVYPDDLTKEVAEAIGLGKPQGALVTRITAGGPGEKAGLELGDVITRFGGKPVEKAVDLRRLAASSPPGTKVPMQVFRRGSYKELTATLDALPDDRAAATPEPEAPAQTGAQAWGLTVSELTDAQRKELKLTAGLKVDAVDGAAARAGLRPGDLILSVSNTEIKTLKQFQAVLAKVEKGKPLQMLVRRGDAVTFVVLKPGKG
ncbi:serine protease Do [Roseateles sp. YR242]|uniref:DegQ family serine endoprotease n=1 Tax=Roseateles sp. YR242 TaxID=1855305 RepID=UPI0008CC7433|nr:DegQ family serine endoprotease [Roseateles sp. YR242]SEK56578.1 serine protease Do [Roseateles sp. YR242]